MRTRNRQSAKAAGRFFENQVAHFLRDVHPHVERRRQAGAKDRGDLINTWPWTIECKNEKSIDLAGGCEEAKAELANDGRTRWWALIIKRRNRAVWQSYVVMDLDQFRDLMALLQPLAERDHSNVG